MNKSALAGALLASLAFSFPTWGDDQDSDKNEANSARKYELLIPVFVNEVIQPYTLLKKVNAEVYVLDARSEADAELDAFRKLQQTAKKAGADGLIEVKRYVIKDAIAIRPDSTGSGSFFGDDVDSTAVELDQLTLDSYERGQGSLSSAVIDDTFDRSRFSQKIVRFTGKAVKLEK